MEVRPWLFIGDGDVCAYNSSTSHGTRTRAETLNGDVGWGCWPPRPHNAHENDGNISRSSISAPQTASEKNPGGCGSSAHGL